MIRFLQKLVIPTSGVCLIFYLAYQHWDSPTLTFASLVMMGYLPVSVAADKLEQILRKKDDAPGKDD